MSKLPRIKTTLPSGRKESEFFDVVDGIKKDLRKAAPGNLQMGMSFSQVNFEKNGKAMMAVVMVMGDEVEIIIGDKKGDG